VARISFDGQGFVVGGRRVWLMGAAMESALLPRSRWAPSLSLLRQCGFNTIRTSAPWSLHEPRPGQRGFEGSLALREFIELCREQSLWAIVRIGPCVGGTFSGGGLPAWLSELEGVQPREPNDGFLRLVSSWYASVLSQLKGLEAGASSGRGERAGAPGGLLAVQIEHGWTCGNTDAGVPYLRELRRFVREAGLEVPIFTSNGLWMVADEAIDVWEGEHDLFSHTRQLRLVQAESPAIVELAHRSELRTNELPAEHGRDLVERVASVLAAGGQPIVAHAAAEMHRREPAGVTFFGVLRSESVEPRLVADTNAPTADLRALTALARFASRFGTALGSATGGDAVVVDPDHAPAVPPVVVTRSSSAGTIAFIFRAVDAAPKGRRTRRESGPSVVQLVTPDGVRLPVTLGQWPVSWVAMDLDLQGRERLDSSTLAPIDLIDGRLLVLAGAAGSMGSVSISGSAVEVRVPDEGSSRPSVLEHAGLTLVVCSEAQAGAMRSYGRGIVIGADVLETDGSMQLAPGFKDAVRIEADGRVQPVAPSARASGAARASSGERTIAPDPWQRASSDAFVDGTSATFASIERPRSLAAYAASSGMGWYRLRLPAARAAQQLWLPGASGTIRVFADGAPVATIDAAGRLPLALPGGAGSAGIRTLTMLVADSGRPTMALHQEFAAGVGAEGWIVEPVRISPKVVKAPPFDPFERRGFVPGAPGPAPSEAIEFSLRQAPKGPIVIDPGEAFLGAVLCNGRLVDIEEIGTGCSRGIVVGPGAPGWGRGAITISLVPLRPAPGLSKKLRVFARVEVVEPPARGTTAWAFARWEAPPPQSAAWCDAGDRARSAAGAEASQRSGRGTPAWWRTRVTASGTPALTLDGLTAGVVLVDGRIEGRYSAGDSRLSLPPGSLERGADLVLFDEEGASPRQVRIIASRRG